MYIYQLGGFGYNEGNITPSIILEHKNKFSRGQVFEMLTEISKDSDGYVIPKKELAQELCDRFDFKIIETYIINTYEFYEM